MAAESKKFGTPQLISMSRSADWQSAARPETELGRLPTGDTANCQSALPLVFVAPRGATRLFLAGRLVYFRKQLWLK
jgi:hypothetical protein